MDRYNLEKKIITKALKDPTFKKKLLSSPKEAVKEALKGDKTVNLQAFDHIHIQIHQEKESEITLVLPYVKETNKALSDKEIENLFAAGGCGFQSW
jgi:hypothetical protein